MRRNVRVAINYEEVESLSYKKTLAFVNGFVINTTQFLNRFSFLCEQKLAGVSRDIQRLETTMSILEAKLASIPELEGITAASGGAAAAPSGPVAPAGDGVSAPASTAAPEDDDDDFFDDEGPAAAAPAPAPAAGGGEAAEAAAEPAAPSGMTMEHDPRYSRYFKMVKMGVLAAQVKQKMMMEGVDPDILDNPDAPSDYVEPGGGGDSSEEEEEWDDE
eukprot:TRINITY_DN15869_c0_g1_i1.p2 TRINITY_DN15869_c0_g1~~TRINITY_DN15869_c0_g1_i1.p2  ORF type:complete len:218 (-),score=79.87 TRINITY_DN15869_c0_g1_i1:49-702(-)